VALSNGRGGCTHPSRAWAPTAMRRATRGAEPSPTARGVNQFPAHMGPWHGVKSAGGSDTRRESSPTRVGRAPCALQAAAELWVEAPRRICSFVILAILDGQHGGVVPGSARLGAARRTGWSIWRRSATRHIGARRCAPAPTSGGRRSCKGIGISTVKHLIRHPSTCQNEVATRLHE